jgi:chromosome segregation ATPase
MNSTNFNVSGKNATTSIFITISENQKEEAERLEYEIKNSHTSSEEEAEKYVDDEDCEEEEEIKTYQLSVTNHEKKYEWLQNLYCEEKQKRIDLEKQSKIDESELIWYKNSCARLQEEEFKSKEMRIEANKYDNKIYNKLEKEVKQLKSDVFTLKTTIEARDESIKTICDERSTLYDEIQLLKKKEEDDFKEHNKRFWKHKEEIKYLKKENKELDDRLTIILKHKDNLLKELREERIFRRDNEDNFFRLLDENRRLEKVMKNVTI